MVRRENGEPAGEGNAGVCGNCRNSARGRIFSVRGGSAGLWGAFGIPMKSGTDRRRNPGTEGKAGPRDAGHGQKKKKTGGRDISGLLLPCTTARRSVTKFARFFFQRGGGRPERKAYSGGKRRKPASCKIHGESFCGGRRSESRRSKVGKPALGMIRSAPGGEDF